MSKIYLFLFCVLIVSAGCLKDKGCSFSQNTYAAPASEQQALKAYLDSVGVQATKDSSGIYYIISSPGTGTDKAALCSQITINYSGKLITGGAPFDSQNGAVFQLGTLIEGWKRGIPLIHKGGQIRLFIPPSLGYGSTDVKDRNNVVVIPGKSILIFDITLIDFTAG